MHPLKTTEHNKRNNFSSVSYLNLHHCEQHPKLTPIFCHSLLLPPVGLKRGYLYSFLEHFSPKLNNSFMLINLTRSLNATVTYHYQSELIIDRYVSIVRFGRYTAINSLKQLLAYQATTKHYIQILINL